MAIVPMDLSVLIGFTGYTSSALAATRASRAAAAREDGSSPAVKVDVKTPWDASNSISDTARLVKAMQADGLVDETDSAFNKPGVPADYKKLFALYKGLATLQTLANAAADKNAPAGTLAGLNTRFQSGFSEVMSYASGLELDTLTLLTGAKQSAAKTAASVARPGSVFTTRTVVQGDVQAPMTGLENAAPFTINVKRGSTTTAVAVDLADMTQPRNLGNVIAFINGKLADAGIQTRLQRLDVTPEDTNKKDNVTPPKQFAVRINGYSSETVSFEPSAPSTALYMANQGKTSAELRKLSVDGAAPTTVFRSAIAAADGDISVRQSAVDGDGNVFVLGTTSADLGSQLNQSSSDVMLRKYDSAGNLLWSKLLGATSEADGLGLAVDSKGAAVIAGQISGKLDAAVASGGKDSLVVKISAAGEEIFARQFGSALNDGAAAVAVGPDDAIYVGGQTSGRMVGAAASVGGADAYVMKFDAAGGRIYTRQFGTTGEDKVAALAIDGNGDLIVASTESGQGVVRKFATADATSAAVWSETLGDLSGGGSITGLAVESGAVYLAGSTANAALTGSGASVGTAHSGGMDGYVFKLDDAGASASAAFVSYLGSGASDKINGLAVSNGRIFVAGETKGALPGANLTLANATNAFAAELDANGAPVWASQFGVTSGEGYGRGLAVDPGGASALDALGLPTGPVFTGQTRTLTAQTTARAGDYFTIQVGELTARRITIAAGETTTTLVRKLNAVLQLSGKAGIVRTGTGEQIKIEPKEGQSVTLKAGAGHLDALAGLGLSAGRYVKAASDAEANADSDELPTYALGLKASYSLATTESAVTARSAIVAAMASIRTAYRELTMDPETKKLLAENKESAKGRTGGAVPAYLQTQLANYNSGLQRLLAGSSSSSSGSLL